MAKPLKTAGLAELTALRRRVQRQLAMERISRLDGEDLLHKLNEIEARIINMREEGEDGD